MASKNLTRGIANWHLSQVISSEYAVVEYRKKRLSGAFIYLYF